MTEMAIINIYKILIYWYIQQYEKYTHIIGRICVIFFIMLFLISKRTENKFFCHLGNLGKLIYLD